MIILPNFHYLTYTHIFLKVRKNIRSLVVSLQVNTVISGSPVGEDPWVHAGRVVCKAKSEKQVHKARKAHEVRATSKAGWTRHDIETYME